MERARPLLVTAGLALALLGVGISSYLTVEHGRGASPVCVFGQGCRIVAQSTYARWGSLPTAAFGLLMYLVLAVLYGVRLASPPPWRVEQAFRLLALALTFAGTGVSAWLTYVELYVLRAVCIWCVVSAGAVTLLLAVAVAELLLSRIAPVSTEARGTHAR